LTDERWQRVKALFQAAVERPAEERDAFLASAAGDDDELRREVESLLTSDAAGVSFLDRLPVASEALRADPLIVLPASMGQTPAQTVLPSGHRVGAYEVVAPLGAGGMGEVYKARDTRLDRIVAIKVLPAHVARDSLARDRFEREARAVAALNHPHICTLHDIGSHDGLDFLVMEYLDGQTLAARLEKGPLTLEQAVQCAIQIASALDRAHRAGIVHRDLKPGNVILTKAGAKLLDFGLAKAMTAAIATSATAMAGSSDLTAPGLIVGTVPYMAPEQIEGKEADARTDLFAFGSVLFEMVSGRKAFQGDSQASLMAAILEREPPPLSSLQPLATPALERIVQACLAKDPDDRWQTARDLLRELQWLAESDAEADDARATAPQPGRRRMVSALMIGALGAVAAVGYLAGARTASAPVTAVRVDRLTDFPGLEEYPAISPDGRSVAFTADEGGRRQIWVKLIAGGAPLQLTRDAGEHLRPRWFPDSSSIIYFSQPTGGGLTGTLWEISALGGAPRRIVDSLADGDVSHDGRRLVFVRSADGRLQLVTADRDGTNSKVIVDLAAGYSYVSPRWSPDDTLIAYQRNRMSLDDDVFVVPASGGEPRGITQANNRMSGFAWLPDGSGIVMSSSRGSTLYYLPSFNLWTVSLKGGVWRQDTFGEVSYLYPDVDRTGTLMATRLQLRSDIWRYPVDFSGVENVRRGVRVTRQTGQVRTPTVGPGDKEVAYVSDSGGHTNIWVTKLDTGESRQITYERDPEISVGVPVWSPDGQHIAFASSREAPKGQNGYWLVSPDGSRLRNLRLLAGWADWSADSRWVYYSEDPRRAAVSKVAIDGGQPVDVRTDTATRPAISRDGSALYWLVELLAGSGLADYEIRTASPEDGPARTLAHIPAIRVPIWLMIQPVISPDGKWLALPLVDNGTSNIWAVSTTDGTFRQLTDFGRRATFIARRLSWSSDSRFVFAALGEGEADVVLLAGVVSPGR
jgi:eukaryotic-like serine/threonine-protein kinase